MLKHLRILIQLKFFQLPSARRIHREGGTGSPVTVLVGNIMDRAPDVVVRHVRSACGHVLSWKGVQTFGFCKYAGPDAGPSADKSMGVIVVLEKMSITKEL